MTSSSAFLERLDALAASCFRDSQRWFPELHSRPRAQIAGHYALGLIGEVGEVEEVLYITRDAEHLAPELADCLVYSLDLAALFGWHTAGLLEADDHLPRLVLVEIGRLANTAKKINRGDPLGAELLADFHGSVGFILRRTVMIARQNAIDLETAYHDKHAVLVERWGPA